jgi:hypothetical protein
MHPAHVAPRLRVVVGRQLARDCDHERSYPVQESARSSRPQGVLEREALLGPAAAPFANPARALTQTPCGLRARDSGALVEQQHQPRALDLGVRRLPSCRGDSGLGKVCPLKRGWWAGGGPPCHVRTIPGRCLDAGGIVGNGTSPAGKDVYTTSPTAEAFTCSLHPSTTSLTRHASLPRTTQSWPRPARGPCGLSRSREGGQGGGLR